jgi:hypothetical protein
MVSTRYCAPAPVERSRTTPRIFTSLPILVMGRSSMSVRSLTVTWGAAFAIRTTKSVKIVKAGAKRMKILV